MTHNPSWTAKTLGLLVGHTITGTFVDKDDEYCGFSTEDPKGNKYRVWVDGDEEGNYCGSVSVHGPLDENNEGERLDPEGG